MVARCCQACCSGQPPDRGPYTGVAVLLSCFQALRLGWFTHPAPFRCDCLCRSKPGVSTDVLQLAEVTVEAAF